MWTFCFNRIIIIFLLQGLEVDDFMRGKLDITMKELIEERDEALQVCED